LLYFLVTNSQVCHLVKIYTELLLTKAFSWYSNLNLASNLKLCVFSLLLHTVKKNNNKSNCVLDIAGCLKEFSNLKLFTQDNSTSQFVTNLLLNLIVLKHWFWSYPSCSERDYVNHDWLTQNVYSTKCWSFGFD